MLFGTTTSVYSNLGAVSQSVFDDTWPYLILCIGVPLAFFIIEMLIDLIRTDRSDKRLYERVDKITAETERLLGEKK